MKPDSFFNLFASVRVMRAAFSDAFKRVRSYKTTYTSESQMTDEQRADFDAAFKSLDAAVVNLDHACQHIDRVFKAAKTPPQ